MRFSQVPRPVRNVVLVAAAAVSVTTACGPPAAAAVLGNPSDFSVNVNQGWLQRWNPCTPVHYKVDDHLVPSALANVKAAVATLSKATGITFAYDGLTNYVPSTHGAKQPASLVISFARHIGQAGGSNLLAGGYQLGEGGFTSTYTTVRQGSTTKITSYKITSGFAVIDAAGYSASTAKVKTATVLHELGHAVGLNHAHAVSEVMYPTVSNAGAGTYSSGDLAGLKRLGRTSGCLS